MLAAIARLWGRAKRQPEQENDQSHFMTPARMGHSEELAGLDMIEAQKALRRPPSRRRAGPADLLCFVFSDRAAYIVPLSRHVGAPIFSREARRWKLLPRLGSPILIRAGVMHMVTGMRIVGAVVPAAACCCGVCARRSGTEAPGPPMCGQADLYDKLLARVISWPRHWHALMSIIAFAFPARSPPQSRGRQK